MVAVKIQREALKVTSGDRLLKLETNFRKLARLRPNFSASLDAASKSAKGLMRFREQSQEHHRITRSMLSLIDAYVRLHKKTMEGREIVLPASMRTELERLKLHRGLTLVAPTRNLRKALDAHNRKRYQLHDRAARLIEKHGIEVTF